jgi:ATP-dependent RNA helicase RhlE
LLYCLPLQLILVYIILTSFDQLNLILPISDALKAEGYERPTPIQREAIPVILERRDLFGIAQTGTGKTAAFAIPILQLLNEDTKHEHGRKHIRALICTPTRELAIQIDESFAAYGKNLSLKHTVIFGGVDQKAQVNRLRGGIDILIATPGRLLDLIGQKIINLSQVSLFVLDEADRMLDMGFIHDIKKLITHLPQKRQSLFFSATMPPDILKLAGSILNKPATVEVTPTSSTVEKITQEIYMVNKTDKKKLLAHLLKDNSIQSALIFTRTKHGADRVAKELSKSGINALAIHGNKSQNARQNALNNFKDGKIRVLVATDIAARGIDVEELSHVFNYELPNVPETYVHRIGRTGRAGASGKAISFCDHEERAYLKDINKLIRKELPVITQHPFPMSEVAPPEEPKPAQGRRPQHGRPAPKAAAATGDGERKKKKFWSR